MAREHTATVKIIKDGRITIPSEIREIEGIKEGDYLKITVEKIEKRRKNSKTTEDIKGDGNVNSK